MPLDGVIPGKTFTIRDECGKCARAWYRVAPDWLYGLVADRLMDSGKLKVGPAQFFFPGAVFEVGDFELVRVERPDTPGPARRPGREGDVFPPEVWPVGDTRAYPPSRWTRAAFDGGAKVPVQGEPSYVAPPQLYIQPKSLTHIEFPALHSAQGHRMIRKAFRYRVRCWWQSTVAWRWYRRVRSLFWETDVERYSRTGMWAFRSRRGGSWRWWR